MMKSFYEPTAEVLAKLSEPWCCSYSGGKDSTSLVTWIEWLRRSGQLKASQPKLVRSDTGVEDPALVAVAEELTWLLERCGWQCALVQPPIHQKLYNRILGIGNTPIHPGITSMRWCTRSTKIDPMNAWRATHSSEGLVLTGLRLGESAMRDGKLKRRGCSAGGECGIPDPGDGNYSPCLHWKTCQVWDWLMGGVSPKVCHVMKDVFAVTKHLADIYGATVSTDLFGQEEVESTARFGCIGCPAISAEAHAPKSAVRRNGEGSPLNELYDVWHEARLPENRLVNLKPNRKGRPRLSPGPIRMAVRKRLFKRVMDIQKRAGVMLITPEDEAFIRQCWKEKRYPGGWSEADEAVEPPGDAPLFET